MCKVLRAVPLVNEVSFRKQSDLELEGLSESLFWQITTVWLGTSRWTSLSVSSHISRRKIIPTCTSDVQQCVDKDWVLSFGAGEVFSIYMTSEWLTLPLCSSVCWYYMKEGLDLKQWFSKCGPCIISISTTWWSGNLLETHIIWLCPRPAESETRGRPQQH